MKARDGRKHFRFMLRDFFYKCFDDCNIAVCTVSVCTD